MSLDLAATAFVTLFVIIDPIGLAPLFVALTRGMSAGERNRGGLRAAVIGASRCWRCSGFAGEALLSAVGIGMPAFRIAGGMLLFLTAVDMLFERRQPRREKSAQATTRCPTRRCFRWRRR